MVVRAASGATTPLQLSRPPSRGSLNKGNSQFISRNIINRALDYLLLKWRRWYPSVKSIIWPTSRVMMGWLIDWPTTWQLVEEPVKHLAPSQKRTRSQGMGRMRVNGSQVTSRAIMEEAMIWTIPCWTVTVERLCLEKNPPSRNRLLVSWWMDNSSSFRYQQSAQANALRYPTPEMGVDASRRQERQQLGNPIEETAPFAERTPGEHEDVPPCHRHLNGADINGVSSTGEREHAVEHTCSRQELQLWRQESDRQADVMSTTFLAEMNLINCHLCCILYDWNQQSLIFLTILYWINPAVVEKWPQ